MPSIALGFLFWVKTCDLMKDILVLARSDLSKNVLATGCVVGGLLGYYFLVPDVLLYKVLVLLAGFLFAVLIFATTTKGHDLYEFLTGAKIEVSKMIWPNRKETLRSTLVVLGTVFVVAVMLWAVDLFFAWIMRIVIK